MNDSSISLNDAAASLGDPAAELRSLRTEFTRFMMRYKFGMEEVLTKISILREELAAVGDHNPIEHVKSRLKEPESIVAKARRKGCDASFEAIGATIHDIAGVRVTCSFESDVYAVFGMLERQPDLTVLAIKDYIANPKPNGYRSLHAIVEVPVYLSDGPENVRIELQVRTIAMDFWASLEHKIHYKFGTEVPNHIVSSLRSAADVAAELDATMQGLHTEVTRVRAESAEVGDPALVPSDEVVRQLYAIRDAFRSGSLPQP